MEKTAVAEPAWFAELFAGEHAKLIRGAQRIMGSPADAEDVVQDAFLRAWGLVGRYDPARGPASAWLATIVRSTALDAIRHRRAVMRRPVVDVTATSQDSDTHRPDACDHLLRAGIARLPAVERVMIDLSYFEGLSHSEIARVTNLPLGTVKTRVRAGVKHLRAAVPRDALDTLLIDRAQAERDRISALLDARLLRHATDVYFLDLLTPQRRMNRAHWGHVDPAERRHLDDIWRFAPDVLAHQHPARQTVDQNRPQVVLEASDSWRQQIALSASHLALMRRVRLESLICQPVVMNGRMMGALTLVRTGSSQGRFTAHDAADAHVIAGDVAHLLARQPSAA